MSASLLQDDCDLGFLVRRLEAPDTGNVVTMHGDGSVWALTPEEALVHWILDLPDGASIDRAAEYALRAIDRGTGNSPPVDRLCGYLRQARVAASAPRRQVRRRHGRRDG